MIWLPIDTAPKDGTDVLLLEGKRVWIGRYDVTEHVTNGKVDFRREGWNYIGSFLNMGDPRPTHWLPIPPLPDGEAV